MSTSWSSYLFFRDYYLSDNFAKNFMNRMDIFFREMPAGNWQKLFLILLRLVCCRELCYLLLLHLCTSVAKTLLAFCDRVTFLAFSDARHVTNLLRKSQIIASYLGRFIWIHRNFLAYLSSWVFKTENFKTFKTRFMTFFLSVWKCSFFKNQKILMSNEGLCTKTGPLNRLSLKKFFNPFCFLACTFDLCFVVRYATKLNEYS